MMRGSVEKRGEFSWRLVVRDGGEKLKRSIKVKSKDEEKQRLEAERALALFIDEIEKGQMTVNTKMTFSELVAKWRKSHAEINLEHKTLHRQNELLETRILPAIGKMRISRIRPSTLLDFYSNLREEGIRLDIKYAPKDNYEDIIKDLGYTVYSLCRKAQVSENISESIKKKKNISVKNATKIADFLKLKIDDLFDVKDKGTLAENTVHHHHRLISAILGKAVEWELLASNPALKVRFSGADEDESTVYTYEEALSLLDALRTEPLIYKVIVTLDLTTGLRCGEIMGLSWSDFNLDVGYLKVKRASQYTPDKGTYEKKPKTKKSRRGIALPRFVIKLLESYREYWDNQKENAGDKWIAKIEIKNEKVENDRLFVNWDGSPMYTYTISHWFPEFLKRHSLPKITFHGLRHTNISILLDQGFDLNTIGDHSGHSRASIILDRYGHSLKKGNRAIANKMDELFSDENNIIND
jgi:integrase